ncbi:MAG: protein containing Six-hairpin glycosidase-like domain protein, partial [Campylobacterales bacterium]
MALTHAAFTTEKAGEDEKAFIADIRRILCGEPSEMTLPERFALLFDPACSQCYVTLFQRGQKPLRWGARRATLFESISRAVEGLRNCSGFGAIDPADASGCRIMVEMVTESHACDLQKITGTSLSIHRFEPGVTGLRFESEGRRHYFMPTDAMTHSIMSVRQLLNFLSKRLGVSERTHKISERVEMVRSMDARCSFIKSIAIVSYEEEVLPLYRGIPVPVTLSVQNIEMSLRNSVAWLAENLKTDGRVLYFYDPISDSEVDFQHPNMTDPTYYNILRHCGGTITLLMGYERFGDDRMLKAARRSLDYFVTTLKTHHVEGTDACYPFYNGKSKLGGAGIGLSAIMHYKRLTGDGRYRKYAEGLVHHILSRIEPDGEMVGYFLHPAFRNGAPLTNVTDDEKRGLFSFYYPGEALLGLALYYQYAGTMA